MALTSEFYVATQRAIQFLVTAQPPDSELRLDYIMYFSTDGVWGFL